MIQSDGYSTLYLNDGQGNFSENNATSFKRRINGHLAFGDVDSDGDMDYLIGGWEESISGPQTALYLNDGSGNFSEAQGWDLVGVQSGYMAFSDLDGDSDEDLVITGIESFSSQLDYTKIYLNDGSGIFAEQTGTPLEGFGLFEGELTVSDIDADGDTDIIVTGSNFSGKKSNLYLNDGSANFIHEDAVFTGISGVTTDLLDLDNDGYQDVIISGTGNSGTNRTSVYLNEGASGFSRDFSSEFLPINLCAAAVSYFDNDNDLDYLIAGGDGTTESINLYFNFADENLNPTEVTYFEEETENPLEGFYNSSTVFADLDGDGDQDLIYAGEVFEDGPVIGLLFNDGSGKLTVKSSPFVPVFSNALDVSDVDGDGDIDILYTGYPGGSSDLAKLLLNDGSGNFSDSGSNPIPATSAGTVDFADLDGDGDEDLFITGISGPTRVSNVYLNNGSGNFTLTAIGDFVGVFSGDVAISDVDGDDDLDILINGRDSNSDAVTKLYLNDGSASFTEVADTPFIAVEQGNVAFGDVDGDGDPDVIISGIIDNITRFIKLYLNDGSGNYTEDPDIPFAITANAEFAFADVDNDNDQDIFIVGGNQSNLYLNGGDGDFFFVENPFQGVNFGSVAVVDIDNDEDIDVFINGIGINNVEEAKLYINTTNVLSTTTDISVYTALSAYPNPTIGTQLYVEYTSLELGSVNLTVFDSNGRVVRTQKESVVDGLNTLAIPMDKMVSGSYFLSLNNGIRPTIAKFIVP